MVQSIKYFDSLYLATMKYFMLFLCTLFFLNVANAQVDAHYWTNQYGGRALLLNGAVIASTDDETAVFYNPGAMAMGEDDDFSLSLSFITPSHASLKTRNYFGQGRTIKDTEFGFAPGLAAIGFTPFKYDNIRLAITSFTRFKSNLRFRYRTLLSVKDTENQIYEANLDFSRRLSERWVGIGASWRILDVVGIGITQFVTFHSESTDLGLRQEIFDGTTNALLAGWRSRTKYSFNTNGRMITKFGLSLHLNDIKIGVTVTTPSYKELWSKASYELDELKIFSPDSLTLATNLDDAELLDYKTPLSVGVGVDVPIGKHRVSFSLEYFTSVPNYTLIDDTDDPLNGLSETPATTNFNVSTGNRQVTNFAVGCQTPISSKSTLIWGFRTDFNQRRKQQNNVALQILSTTPSVAHVSIGNVLEIWNSKFSLGLDYGFGLSNSNSPRLDVNKTNVDNLFDEPDIGKVNSRFRSLIVIIAYDFSLRK